MKILVAVVIIILILISYLFYEYQRSLHLIAIGEAMAAATVPFSRTAAPSTSPIPGGELRIAMVGDSTGVGTGASVAEFSIAGLTAAKYPSASLVNVAVNGAKTNEALAQLAKLDGHFNLILIDVGGNDNVRFTNYDELSSSIKQVLAAAVAKSDHVLLTTTGNVGTVPLLPWFSRFIFAHRSRVIRQLFIDVVAATNGDVRYTDLYRDPSIDPFALEPKKYYARDLFHPSDAGYADWFYFINQQLDEFHLVQ